MEGGTKVYGAIAIVGYMPKTERKGKKSSDLNVFVRSQILDITGSGSIWDRRKTENGSKSYRVPGQHW